jgi:hypothetical protein
MRPQTRENFATDTCCKKPEPQDPAEQNPCMEHLWQEAVMSPSIDLKILESHCDMSSEKHSSLRK